MMKLRNDVNFEKFVGLKNIFLAEVDSDSSHQGAKVCRRYSKYYDIHKYTLHEHAMHHEQDRIP